MFSQCGSWAHVQQKHFYKNVYFFLTSFVIAKKWKQPKCLLTKEWLHYSMFLGQLKQTNLNSFINLDNFFFFKAYYKAYYTVE